MKIGITIPYASVNYAGGINVQCRMWQDGLKHLGHDVFLLNPWDFFDYKNFDFLFIMGYGKLLIDQVRLFKQFDKPRIVSAPIFDPNTTPLWKFKIKSRYYGAERFYINNPLHDMYKCRNDFSLFFARSEFEKTYIVKGMGIPENKVKIVPLHMRFKDHPSFDLRKKDNNCLHVSRLAAPEKNVGRLIDAAKKYGFNLRLAGTIHGDDERTWLERKIDGHSNIKYIGFLSEEALIEEYRNACVLALPSINEGVGMVALEAAAYGCEICLTNLGGPKEYYHGRAVLVNPYDIDSIGQGVMEAMNNKHSQPELSQFVLDNYSMIPCMKKMESYLNEIINKRNHYV